MQSEPSDSVFCTRRLVSKRGALFVIQYLNEHDAYCLDLSGKLLRFSDEAKLLSLARDLKIKLERGTEEAGGFDILIAVVEGFVRGDMPDVDCGRIIDVINFAEDLQSMSYGKNSRAQIGDVYEKLFWGANNPAVTPVGKSYNPIWAQEELTALHNYLQSCLAQIFALVDFETDSREDLPGEVILKLHKVGPAQ